MPGWPVVVLIHGAMDRSASFGRTMRRTGDMDVVTYDRRGYGASLGAGVAPTLSDHARDLSVVLDWTGARRAVLVGHSLGGTIAATLELTGDERILALGVFESPFPILDDSFDSIGGGAMKVADDEGPAAAAEFFYRLMVGEQTWARLRERDRQARRAEGPALVAEMKDIRCRESAVDPALLNVPLVIGRGELSSDRLRSGAQLLAESTPATALVEIAGAGHGAHLTHPDEFARFCRASVALVREPGIPAPRG